jgi:gamma-glutamylcyclotransferase (GGCT)/AIG2-like uncharacterized protein YtfP
MWWERTVRSKGGHVSQPEQVQTPPQEELPVFVYGTLRTGQDNYVRFLGGKTAREIPATLPEHQMYVAGDYPFVTDAMDDSTVVGDLMFLAPERYQAVLADLDGLEGYRLNDLDSPYLRVKRSAHYIDAEGQARRIETWVYHGGLDCLSTMSEDNRVASGDWAAYVRTRRP